MGTLFALTDKQAFMLHLRLADYHAREANNSVLDFEYHEEMAERLALEAERLQQRQRRRTS